MSKVKMPTDKCNCVHCLNCLTGYLNNVVGDKCANCGDELVARDFCDVDCWESEVAKVKVIFADRTMIGVLDSSVDEVQWLREHSLIPFGEVVRHTYGTQTFVRYENRGQVITAYAYDMPIESLTIEQLGTTVLQQQTNQGDTQMEKRTYVININDGEWWHEDNYRTAELDFDEVAKLEEMTPAQRREFAVNKGQRIAGAQ